MSLPKVQIIDVDDLDSVTCIRSDGSLGTLRDLLAAYAPQFLDEPYEVSLKSIEELTDEEMRKLALETFGSIGDARLPGAAIQAMNPREQIEFFTPLGESMVNAARMVLLHTELLIKAGKVARAD